MSELKPCPFCGEPPVRNDALGDYACYVHPYNGCFLECCVIPPEKFEKWNTRKSEPRKCCANCKHCDVWDQGFDEMPYIKCGNPVKKDDWGMDHDLPNGVVVCEKWESIVKWEEYE